MLEDSPITTDTNNSTNALILVDLQNDFLPGGALAVPGGNQVTPIANELSRVFSLVVATQDWHPAGHCSFAINHPGRKVGDWIDVDGISQMLWPKHCVQETFGSELAGELKKDRITRVFYKGTDPTVDSYSGFYDNGHRRSTGLGELLNERGVSSVYVMGLATDYCVKFTILDAIAAGFETFIVADGCRGVELQPGDSDLAMAEMQKAGTRIVHSPELLVRVDPDPARDNKYSTEAE